MGMMTIDIAPGKMGSAPANVLVFEDPLDADEAGDAVVRATRRGLTRLALVAAETGARFQREEVGHDAMAWMLAPRRLFDGERALDACLSLDACMRAILLHGLSIGLDAEPAQIDALLCDGPADGGGYWDGADPGDGGGRDARRRAGQRQRLYSAIIVIARGGELVHLFHASVAATSSVVRERIRSRFGKAAAVQADIRVGVDLDCPATAGLLPPAFREMVEGSRRVRWSTMAGFDVTVEHRIPS